MELFFFRTKVRYQTENNDSTAAFSRAIKGRYDPVIFNSWSRFRMDGEMHFIIQVVRMIRLQEKWKGNKEDKFVTSQSSIFRKVRQYLIRKLEIYWSSLPSSQVTHRHNLRNGAEQSIRDRSVIAAKKNNYTFFLRRHSSLMYCQNRRTRWNDLNIWSRSKIKKIRSYQELWLPHWRRFDSLSKKRYGCECSIRDGQLRHNAKKRVVSHIRNHFSRTLNKKDTWWSTKYHKLWNELQWWSWTRESTRYLMSSSSSLVCLKVSFSESEFRRLRRRMDERHKTYQLHTRKSQYTRNLLKLDTKSTEDLWSFTSAMWFNPRTRDSASQTGSFDGSAVISKFFNSSEHDLSSICVRIHSLSAYHLSHLSWQYRSPKLVVLSHLFIMLFTTDWKAWIETVQSSWAELYIVFTTSLSQNLIYNANDDETFFYTSSSVLLLTLITCVFLGVKRLRLMILPIHTILQVWTGNFANVLLMQSSENVKYGVNKTSDATSSKSWSWNFGGTKS